MIWYSVEQVHIYVWQLFDFNIIDLSMAIMLEVDVVLSGNVREISLFRMFYVSNVETFLFPLVYQFTDCVSKGLLHESLLVNVLGEYRGSDCEYERHRKV